MNASSASSSLSVTPVHDPCFSVPSASPPPLPETPLTALAGEQLEVDYQVHELLGDITDSTVGEPLRSHQHLLQRINTWLAQHWSLVSRFWRQKTAG